MKRQFRPDEMQDRVKRGSIFKRGLFDRVRYAFTPKAKRTKNIPMPKLPRIIRRTQDSERLRGRGRKVYSLSTLGLWNKAYAKKIELKMDVRLLC